VELATRVSTLKLSLALFHTQKMFSCIKQNLFSIHLLYLREIHKSTEQQADSKETNQPTNQIIQSEIQITSAFVLNFVQP
jgi:hypothetical protein